MCEKKIVEQIKTHFFNNFFVRKSYRSWDIWNG